jgi:hypothetical protein
MGGISDIENRRPAAFSRGAELGMGRTTATGGENGMAIIMAYQRNIKASKIMALMWWRNDENGESQSA